jgi:3-phosphoshikimate 1-carboxyvinyltransferase
VVFLAAALRAGAFFATARPVPRAGADFLAFFAPVDDFAPRLDITASFNAFAGKNLKTRFAGTFTCSPVAGLRAMRAARSRTLNWPKPGIFTGSLLTTAAWISSKTPSINAAASLRESPSTRSMADRVKSTLFIRTFPCESKALVASVPLQRSISYGFYGKKPRMSGLGGQLRGECTVPGDKSISHRALIAAVRADGPVAVENFNTGNDVTATRRALEGLGVRMETLDGGGVLVHPATLRDPSATLDCANSGSTARMLLGACAGAGIRARMDGDGSLRARPMEPVAAQLRAFGARIETSAGKLPLELRGTPEIQTLNFILLGTSAQVKSALLFAGLFAGVTVSITGDRGSRDHTERLLRYLGADVRWDGRSIVLQAGALRAKPIRVAGDFSSAAFFLTAAAITPGSAVTVREVGVNPTRTGLLDALAAMGADVRRTNEREVCGEPIADLSIEYAPLHSAAFDSALTLRAIDEIPLLAVAAAFARGETTFTGIADLRTKESDRVAGIARLLELCGIAATSQARTLSVNGGNPRARDGIFATHGDHRLAMAAATMACAAGPIQIDEPDSAAVSFPGFFETLERLGAERSG